MNKLFTWLIGLANPLWRRLGADPDAIRLILTAKLLMDDRSGVVMGRRQQKKQGMEWFMYLMLVLFGLGMIILPVFMEDLASAVGIALSITFVYIGMLLIAEMSENLFDQRDIYILLSRPINDLTLSLARILHIAVFSGKFALCLTGPLAIYLAFFEGIVPFLVFVPLVVMLVVLTMTGTLVSYLIMLRNIPKDRLQKVLGWFQMAITFLFFFAYQMPNLFGGNFDALTPLTIVDKPLGFAFPGFWLGGLFKMLTFNNPGWLAIAQGLLGFAATVGGLWFYVRQSRGYISNMLALREAGGRTPAGELSGTIASGANTGLKPDIRSPWRDRLARLFTHNDLSRVSFRFHWDMMLRDMGFKQRTYPSMVYIPVLILVFQLQDGLADEDFELQASTVFMLLYFITWILIIPLGQVKISDDYRASWIFSAAGNAHPSRLHYGQLMAVLGMFFLPTALLIYPAILIVWGPHLWLDVLFSTGAVLLATLAYHAIDNDPPFSRSKEESKFSNIGPMIGISIVATIVGTVHYNFSGWTWFVAVGTVVVWTANLLWLRYMRR